MNKEAVVEDIEKYFKLHFPKAQPHAACLQWAFAAYSILFNVYARRDAVLQAGSFSWPMRGPEWKDDWESPTHFSYVVDPAEWSQHMDSGVMSMGWLPEVHCWLGLPATYEILDMTTRFIPQQAESTIGAWEAPQPPRYLWCSQLPEGVLYQPVSFATQMMLALLRTNGEVI